MTKKEVEEWLQHPVTEEFKKRLKEYRAETVNPEVMLDRNNTSVTQARVATKVGELIAIDYVLSNGVFSSVLKD
jgi:hypothetical protein